MQSSLDDIKFVSGAVVQGKKHEPFRYEMLMVRREETRVTTESFLWWVWRRCRRWWGAALAPHTAA